MSVCARKDAKEFIVSFFSFITMLASLIRFVVFFSRLTFDPFLLVVEKHEHFGDGLAQNLYYDFASKCAVSSCSMQNRTYR